jgi:hypothetical protein
VPLSLCERSAIKVNDRVQTVILKDSLAILPRDLRSLCKDFIGL